MGLDEIVERVLIGEWIAAGGVQKKVVGLANEGFAEEFEMIETDGTGVIVENVGSGMVCEACFYQKTIGPFDATGFKNGGEIEG